MKIVETRTPITLGGKAYELYFNANSFAAFEEASGKFFLEVVASLFDVLKPYLEARKAKAAQLVRQADRSTAAEAESPLPESSAFDILRKVSMRDLRALLWSALHEYDAQGEPRWPMTLHEVGRQLNLTNITPIFMGFVAGQASNSPTAEEAGESQAASAKKAANGAPPNGADGGGGRSTELPQDAFDFATPK